MWIFGSKEGSGIYDWFDAGTYGPLHNYRESIYIGSFSTVMAILICTELLLSKNLMRRKIHICSDSRAVLAASL
jgi:hypothetical protein